MIKLKKILIKENIDFVKLKKPLYHGTNSKNIGSIKKYGLQFDYEPVHSETSKKRKGRMYKNGVYVTDNIESSLLYAYDASKDAPAHMLDMADANEDNMCIIKINCIPKNAKVGSDGYGDLMINSEIPPKCIEILDTKYLKRFFKVDNLLDVIF